MEKVKLTAIIVGSPHPKALNKPYKPNIAYIETVVGMANRTRDEEIALQLLNKYKGGFISRRDGLVMVKALINDKEVVVWIRTARITRKSWELFKKILSRVEYDDVVIYRTREEAEEISLKELEGYKIVHSLEEIEQVV